MKDLDRDPREDKLPNWAKEKLEALRRTTKEAVTELNAMRTGTEPGPFYLENWRGNEPYYLPWVAGQLTFGRDHRKRMRLTESRHELGLLVIEGDKRIEIRPQSSNVVQIKVKD